MLVKSDITRKLFASWLLFLFLKNINSIKGTIHAKVSKPGNKNLCAEKKAIKNNKILNDSTNDVLSKMALSHAKSGADIIAPSDMMDGRIKKIRETLELNKFHETAIMSYSIKYASNFYGPFRDALNSKPNFGDKKTYQMDFRNSNEAFLEVKNDLEEGADIIMIKPGLPYLDIIRDIKENFSCPIAIYQVSGEYSMLKAAAEKGWLDEKKVIIEQLTAFKRAGASMIVSYHSIDIAKSL